MTLQLTKFSAIKKYHTTLNTFFRFLNVPAFFKKPVEKPNNSLGLFYQDILSKKLLCPNKEKTEVFLKALSANLKCNLLEKIDDAKLEKLLKCNDLKEASHEDWTELHKSNQSSKKAISDYSTLKLYKGKSVERSWGWWKQSSQPVLLAFKTENGGDLQLKMFKNVHDKQILNTIKKDKFDGWIFDRLLFSSSLGLSIGSLLSTILLETLHLPSIAISTTAFTSTTITCYFYNRLCNSQLSALQRQTDVIYDKLYSSTHSCLDSLASKASEKLYPHLLILYVALHKFNHLLSTDGKVKVGETLRNNLDRWMQRELGCELPGDFDMNYSLELMGELGLVRKVGEGSVEVVAFDSALQTLTQLSRPSRFLSEQSNYAFY